MSTIFKAVGLVTLGLLLFSSCHSKKALRSPGSWQPIEAASNTDAGFEDSGDRRNLRRALSNQVSYLVSLAQTKTDHRLQIANRSVSPIVLQSAYHELFEFLETNPSDVALSDYLDQNFEFFQYNGQTYDRRLLVTSYFLPQYRASREPTDSFKIPLYPVPPDLEKGRRYLSRFDIDYRNMLRSRVQPIAWLEHAIDAYYLQVQGSGELVFRDGMRTIVGYSGDNDYPFVALGALLIKDKVRPEGGLNLEGIRQYFIKDPDAFRKYARQMPRYVFFRFKDQAEGTLGLPVISGRTIAVDPTRIPLGMLAYIETQQPVFGNGNKIVDWRPLKRLVLSQDTGGGIRGDHIDLFWGAGDEAGKYASRMKQRASLYLLLPKDTTDKASDPFLDKLK